MLKPPCTHYPIVCTARAAEKDFWTAHRKAPLLNSQTGSPPIQVENSRNQGPRARYGSTNGESQGGEESWMGSVLGDDVPSEFSRVVHAEA